MLIKVRMISFMDGRIREVEVPDDEAKSEEILDKVYYYGQNDIQPVPQICSVSVGDVIEWDDRLYMVKPVGFQEISEEQYAKYSRSEDKALIAYDFDNAVTWLMPK